MKVNFLIFAAVCLCFSQTISAQIPAGTQIQIVRAEDARRYDQTLETFLKSPNPRVRRRAALAAGRIGDERAVPALARLLKDNRVEVQTIAAFALGETESANAAAAILEIINDANQLAAVRARALEAAGKIAAANPKDAKSGELGKAVVAALQLESARRSASNRQTILPGITAILRARPEGGEAITTKFLDDADGRIRSDALNALARLHSKNASGKARELLTRDLDPVVRANAARLLGIGEDKSAVELLLNAATKDVDSRVRVSAIRSLGGLKDANAANALSERANNLLADYKKSNFAKPVEKNELLEIATALSRISPGSNDEKTIEFLREFREADEYESPETEIALAKIAPAKFSEFQKNKPDFPKDWRAVNSLVAGIGELANAPDSAEIARLKTFAIDQISGYVRGQLRADEIRDETLADALAAYAAFKPSDLREVLRDAMRHKDAIVRASSAGLLAETVSSPETIETLKTAFTKSLLTDKRENDAQLAILDALYKLDKKSAVGAFTLALDAPDYLVRKKAFEILKDQDLQKDFPGIAASLKNWLAKKKNQVLPYAAYTGTKLGQIFYTNADYLRAVSRKNGTVKAVFATTKGNFTIDLTPEDAPLTVDNFIKLAKSNYFDGLAVHRVVPNFVMQDGDPRGDGNGGPGWQIRCEINMLPFERGAVGMALSGKDTGGSQWFAAHSPQPHLDGGYTVFGKVNESEMKIVDSIVRGDRILSVKIVEGNGLPKIAKRCGR